MLRRELTQLGLMARSISTSASSCAVPEVSTGGIMSFLNSKSAQTPLNVPLDGVDSITPVQPGSSLPPTETHTLSNGISIASQDTMSPISVVGLFVQNGSSHETPATAGASHLVEALAYKGTSSRTHFATVRQAEAYGIGLTACAGRETTAYFASGPRDNMAAAMEILCDSVINPAYEDHVLATEKSRVIEHVNNLVADPGYITGEGIVSAAFTGGLARPQFYHGADISAADLTKFHADNYTAGNIVVAASNVDAKEVQALASGYLGSLPSSKPSAVPASHYVGGDRTDHWTAGSHVTVAFESAGWKDLESSVTATVIQYLMGGGQDFSSGGPGKGMHSRLYQNVLAQHTWVSSCHAYTNIFENTGLLGITAHTQNGAQAAALVDIVCTQLHEMTRSVTDAEVDRAKRQCLNTVHMALEVPGIVCDDIGRQMLTFGSRVPLESFESTINAVSAATVKEYMRKMVATKPSAVLLGDLAIMPKYETVKSRFQ